MASDTTIAKAGEVTRVLFSMTFRYFLFAGAFYLLFYVWKKRKFWFAKIQQRYPENKYILREIGNSMLSVLIFGAVILLTIIAGSNGLTRVYPDAGRYGYFYYFLSIILMIL